MPGLRLCAQARGCASRHQAGQRDGEPDGHAKVVDFGIARVLEASRTQTGMLIGTFAYMSPEQYHGEHADERSDIWSFGVSLYELLAYKRPFTGETPASLMNSICQKEPAPLRSLLPECPEDLEIVLSKVLRKSPRRSLPIDGRPADRARSHQQAAAVAIGGGNGQAGAAAGGAKRIWRGERSVAASAAAGIQQPPGAGITREGKRRTETHFGAAQGATGFV